MAKQSLITADFARMLFRYDPLTGQVFWRERPVDHFSDESYCMRWNTRFCGKLVGSPAVNGYLRVNINRDFYLLHRVIWLLVHGEWPDYTDHINGNRTDNRLENLRAVTKQENARNTCIRSNNTSGFNGVSLDTNSGRWHAYIGVGGDKRRQSLGQFDTKEEAVAARRAAELVLGYHENHGRAA